MLRVGELGVTRSHGVVLAEVLHLLHGEVIAGHVKPGIQEHGAVAAGQDEAVAVKPLRVLGVVLHEVSVEDRTDLHERKELDPIARACWGDEVMRVRMSFAPLVPTGKQDEEQLGQETLDAKNKRTEDFRKTVWRGRVVSACLHKLLPRSLKTCDAHDRPSERR